jgi:hypothetical protein
MGYIFLIGLVLCLNFYLAVLIKDGYNEIYDENLSKFKKSLLLIPPIGVVLGCSILVYFLFIILVDKVKNYFN